jgi:hypothetical protein
MNTYTVQPVPYYFKSPNADLKISALWWEEIINTLIDVINNLNLNPFIEFYKHNLILCYHAGF